VSGGLPIWNLAPYVGVANSLVHNPRTPGDEIVCRDSTWPAAILGIAVQGPPLTAGFPFGNLAPCGPLPAAPSPAPIEKLQTGCVSKLKHKSLSSFIFMSQKGQRVLIVPVARNKNAEDYSSKSSLRVILGTNFMRTGSDYIS
jgi:hypothetical protein